VNAADFGVVGDQFHDDTEAIQAALNAAPVIGAPPHPRERGVERGGAHSPDEERPSSLVECPLV
jgi:hypothetical protein